MATEGINEIVQRVLASNRVQQQCGHLERVQSVEPSAEGCEECLQTGDKWVHLRLCLTCGHVGCCDHSKNKHATKHHKDTGHPIIISFEPDEAWLWCYVDGQLMFADD